MLGQDRQGDAATAALEEGDLVVDDADAVVLDPPAALEVQAPASRSGVGDAPPLPGNDRSKEPPRKAPVAFRQVARIAEEEASLVAGAYLGLAADPPGQRRIAAGA